MEDLELAVQLCLPIEWTIAGSVFTEQEIQDANNCVGLWHDDTTFIDHIFCKDDICI